MNYTANMISSVMLEELSSGIRARPIPWEGYQRAGLMNDHVMKAIKAVEKCTTAKRASIVQNVCVANLDLWASLTEQQGRSRLCRCRVWLAAEDKAPGYHSVCACAGIRFDCR